MAASVGGRNGQWCVLLGEVCTGYWLYLESSLHSTMQDLKAVLAQSRRFNYSQFPSIHDKTLWYFSAALPPLLPHPWELVSPHPHLSMLQCGLTLFLWEFKEFAPFHGFSFFLLLKMARYWEYRCHPSWSSGLPCCSSCGKKETETKQVCSLFCFMSLKMLSPPSFFFECTPSVSTVYALLILVHAS